MTEQELSLQIQAWLEQPRSLQTDHLEELNLLYFHVTGRLEKCRQCQYLARKKVLQNYLIHPTKVNQLQPINIKEMANTNVSKKYALADPKQTVVIFGNYGPEAITAANLTDDAAERILADKNFAHNIVKVAGEETEVDADLEAVRAEYTRVTGQAPGNRKIETLQKEIDAANAEDK